MNKAQAIKELHIGVYGIHFNKGRVLLILKGRGPYKRMYDLPGGRIEGDETQIETLHREFEEETGCSIVNQTFLYTDEYEFKYVSQTRGELLFHHVAHFYSVTLKHSNDIKNIPDGHDSVGATYIDVKNIIDNKAIISPMAKKAILCQINNHRTVR